MAAGLPAPAAPVPRPQPGDRRPVRGHGRGRGGRPQRRPDDRPTGRRAAPTAHGRAGLGDVSHVGGHAHLLRSGAILVTSAGEVLDAVGRLGEDFAEPARGPTTARDELTAELTRVIEVVPARQAQPIDAIAARAGVRLRDAMRALPVLVGNGLVEEVAGGFRLTAAGRASAPAGGPPPTLR